MEHLHCMYIAENNPSYINVNNKNPPSHQDRNMHYNITFILFGPSFIRHNSFPDPVKFFFFASVFMNFQLNTQEYKQFIFNYSY